MTRQPATHTELELLDELGCLPPVDCSQLRVKDGDILPGLVELWTRWRQTAPRRSRDRAVRIECWLRASTELRAALTNGASATLPHLADDWLGRHLFFWPRGIPHGKRVGLAASRLGQVLEARQPVFRVMRQIVSGVATRDNVLVAAETTSLGRMTERCCRLFDRRLLRIVTSPHPSNWLQWLVNRIHPGESPGHEWPVFISPASEFDSVLPLPDLALALLSDQLFVLTLRTGGNLEEIVRRRLTEWRSTSGDVRLAVGDGLCSGTSIHQLQSLGAVGWSLSTGLPDRLNRVSVSTPADVASDTDPCVTNCSLPEEEEEWLTHWTRRTDGPAPGQSEDEFIDALILDLFDWDHSALSNLRRILIEGRLRASGLGLRGGRPGVSFSEVLLRQLVHQRTFRVHRKRWDFEHVGICIQRNVLKVLGARPVIYGDDDVWSELPEGERLWFQQQFSHTPSGTIDWSIEREWRFPGDVDLTRFRPDEAFLFCPGKAEAAALQEHTNWPILTVETLIDG